MSGAAEWRLKRGDEVLGEISVTGGDFPWYAGTFRPRPAFDSVREVFARELQALDEDRIDDLEAIWRDIQRLGLVLERPATGEVVSDFLLHIRDEEAWFRY